GKHRLCPSYNNNPPSANALKASIVPDDAIIDLRNLVRDYYYFKDLQSSIVLKLHAELKVSFPAYLNVFSKVTTQTSLKLLEAYPLAADMLAAPKDELVETIRSTARFGETYALARYDAICTAAKDAAVFGRALPSNALRIRLSANWKERQTMTASPLSRPCTVSAF
uniref:hypothetical protein n=1 Tax=Bacteroides acidifaciens TaxID=85831 RepID=UPI0025A519C9